jgi:hypothetical protein
MVLIAGARFQLQKEHSQETAAVPVVTLDSYFSISVAPAAVGKRLTSPGGALCMKEDKASVFFDISAIALFTQN